MPQDPSEEFAELLSTTPIKEGSVSGDHMLENRDGLNTDKYISKWTYYVVADDDTKTSADILGFYEDSGVYYPRTPGLPLLQQVINGAEVISRKAKEEATIKHPVTGVSTILWTVEITTDTNFDSTGGGGGGGGGGSVEDQIPLVWWSYEEGSHPAFYADAWYPPDGGAEKPGWPIETMAGEPIKATKKRVDPIYNFKRYETMPLNASTWAIKQQTYSNTHPSSATFLGYAWYYWLMMPVEMSVETVNGVRYYLCHYRIKMNTFAGAESSSAPKGGWILEPPHRGTLSNKYDESDSGLGAPGTLLEYGSKILDDQGNPIQANLDDSGVKQGDPGWNPNRAEMFLRFRLYRRQDWSALSIPTQTQQP